MPWRRLPPPTKKQLASEKRGRGKKARFLIDKNVDREVADVLRRLRWNAYHAEESGLGTHEDEDIYAYARGERRVLLTHDPDFLDDRRFPLRLSPGVIVLPGGSGERSALIRALDWLLVIVGRDRELWTGTKVRITEDGTWTVRTFEQETGRVQLYRYLISGRAFEAWEYVRA
jgi:predicted nuclease of predicted toxin-antitoxin system